MSNDQVWMVIWFILGDDPDTCKTVTGFVKCLAGEVISWAYRCQSIVAQSTAEVEYVAACDACMEDQGLRSILIQVLPEMQVTFRMCIDNQDAYVIITSSTYSRKTWYIEPRWDYARDQTAKKTVTLWEIRISENMSDLMTILPTRDMLEVLSFHFWLSRQQLSKETGLLWGEKCWNLQQLRKINFEGIKKWMGKEAKWKDGYREGRKQDTIQDRLDKQLLAQFLININVNKLCVSVFIAVWFPLVDTSSTSRSGRVPLVDTVCTSLVRPPVRNQQAICL